MKKKMRDVCMTGKIAIIAIIWENNQQFSDVMKQSYCYFP